MLSEASVLAPTAAFEPVTFAPLAPSPEHHEEFERARSTGYAEGYAAGLRAAESATRALREGLRTAHDAGETARDRRQADAVAAFEAAAVALRARLTPVLAEADRTLAESALALAEAILGAELRDAAHGARAAFERALSVTESTEVLRIRMNPTDVAQLDREAVSAAGVRVLADTTLAPGDAVAEVPDGYLDARIRSALDRCREVLDGAFVAPTVLPEGVR